VGDWRVLLRKGRIHAHRVAVVQELQPSDKQKSRRFHTSVGQNSDILYMTWFSDEASFHLLGYINSEYACVGCCQTSYHSRGVPHPQNVGVWCALSRIHIIPRPTNTTVNIGVYQDIYQELVNLVDDRKLTSSYCRKDMATCRTSNGPLG
jgi:hypothetical protein